jgi:hypothetical protein
MNEISFDILYERYSEKKTLEEIGDKYDLTRERIRQIISETLDFLLSKEYEEKWKAKNNISMVSDDEMTSFIFFMGLEHRYKLSQLIQRYELKHPKDFLRIPEQDLLKIKNVGRKFILRLKIALLNFGLPYDNNDIESLERKMARINEKNKKFSKNNNNGLKLRFRILERDGFKCQYCGKSPRLEPSTILNVDHIRPAALGGSWSEDNLITACLECNLGKGDLILKKRKQ